MIGYGEDALTLWALKYRLKEILTELGDESSPSDCTVFYRPSFGRGGKDTANFGEFDAIVSTNESVFLIESKWEGSARLPKSIRLSEAQQNRHAIFKEYFDKWDAAVGIQSLTASSSGFLTSIKDKKVASEKDELAEHLRFVISRTTRKSHGRARKNLQNVLLFLHRRDGHPRPSLTPSNFGRVIPIRCPRSISSIDGSWFFEMEPIPDTSGQELNW